MNDIAEHNIDERLISGNVMAEDEPSDHALRPNYLKEFTGQDKVKNNLEIFIKAARKRGEAMDHVLLYGPPGLGKTTLAQITAQELEVNFRMTSGPIITKAGDLAAILTNLQRNDVLFIDEIHRLHPTVEEVLYPAMEDFKLDIIIGEGPAARSIRIDLQPFTLVAATTRAGLITTPLRDRFGIPLHLDYYNDDDLAKICLRGANILNMPLQQDGALEIAKRSRGTPRVAGRLLRRVRDIADVAGADVIDSDIAHRCLLKLEVDQMGLDRLDRNYLDIMIDFYGGGPVGIDTLAAALGNERDVLEDVVEPFLLQRGLLQRTPKGRLLTKQGWRYMGKMPQDQHANQHDDLFNSDLEKDLP